ncbi:hypothetical protein B9G69_015045 [Bdellovibrio sp. SKB1291214]|uniref:hypothetical protein n=1 Tax=Bdellovibrio sp. SKB1291214 TaxID=1732569 RepID=UPI0011306C0B|nr:hypothetical protein [Bdellovibrio sp. SKB1291214]UYL08357.1 hypothetical protein B9G69_015045 [Bdellovibrio sp. SKB1291214]
MEKVHLLHHRQIKPSSSFVSNRRGVTVTELLVVLGMIGIVAIGNASFLFDFTNEMKKITANSEGESELSTLNIAAVNILKKSSVSFNKLYALDDGDATRQNKQNFYDYYPDVPHAVLTRSTIRADRTITLSPTDSKYFYLIQSEEADFDSLIYDPMYAYTVTSTPSDQIASGTIRYEGLNSIPNLQGPGGTQSAKGTMTKVFQTRWADGTYFMLSCPTYLRAIDAKNNTVSILTPPRFPSFLGKVASGDLLPANSSEVGIQFYNSNPLVPTASYTSVDNFFRVLPAIGGAAPFVKVEPVKMVRFEFRTNSTTQKNELWLQEFTQGKYKDKTKLIEEIKNVVFKRSSISLPIISMEVER